MFGLMAVVMVVDTGIVGGHGPRGRGAVNVVVDRHRHWQEKRK